MPKRTFFRLDEDKRERVIRAAIDEFRKNGFENAKVGAIAQNSSIANGSIYQYFDDKRELFVYCVNWTVENFIRDLERQMPLAGMDLFEYLQSGLPGRVAYWRQEPELAMFAHDLMSGDVAFPFGEQNTVKGMYGAHIPKLISNGKKWGALRDDIDEGLITAFITSIVREAEELVYQGSVATGFYVSDEQARANAAALGGIIELLRNGLTKRG